MNCGICGATDMKTCEACPGGYRDNVLAHLPADLKTELRITDEKK